MCLLFKNVVFSKGKNLSFITKTETKQKHYTLFTSSMLGHSAEYWHTPPPPHPIEG